MERDIVIILILCLFFLFFFPFQAHSDHCTRNPVVFNFGDSNSDTGGFSAAYGADFGPPFGRVFHQMERVSDGRLIIDFLCESLKASYLSPYLEPIGSNFKNGANFAIAGAATLPKSKPFSLDVQVSEFLRFRSRSLLLSSNNGYMNLISEEEFKGALYTIDIGQNDIAGAFTYLSYDQVIQNIPTYITQIKDAIWNIYNSGGKNFWIHSTGPLGCLPRELATTTSGKNPSDYDSNGCLQQLNDAAKEFNNQLRILCDQLGSRMSGATIVYVDVYAAKYDLISNAAKYGFKNPLMACCGSGGPPYNFDANVLCGGSTGYTVCGAELRYVSWDGVHYTEAANSFVASKLLSSNFSNPHMGFNFFCNK